MKGKEERRRVSACGCRGEGVVKLFRLDLALNKKWVPQKERGLEEAGEKKDFLGEVRKKSWKSLSGNRTQRPRLPDLRKRK